MGIRHSYVATVAIVNILNTPLLNFSIGDKHNVVVIVNPKNNKENINRYIHNHVCAYSWYTYVHIYTNLIQDENEFYDEVISI